MIRLKKALALTLVATMCLTAFTGCGNDSKGDPNTPIQMSKTTMVLILVKKHLMKKHQMKNKNLLSVVQVLY